MKDGLFVEGFLGLGITIVPLQTRQVRINPDALDSWFDPDLFVQ